jgi:mono/diheme cytochrome c family protein
VIALASVACADASADAGGRRLYFERCARCHGEAAEGDGPDASRFAEPPPRLRGNPVLHDYSDSELVEFVRHGKELRLELRPEALRAEASRTEDLFRFLHRLPTIDWHLADSGREIYYDRCLPCHDDYGRPQARRPSGVAHLPRDLSREDFQSSITDERLRELVRHGTGRMPALAPQIAEPEARAIAAFVRLLSPGYELYDRYCQVCHGIHGEGAESAVTELPHPKFAFDAQFFRRKDPEEIRAGIWHMLRRARPRMPHFGESLTEGELRSILAYLRSLPKESTRPGDVRPRTDTVS